MLTRCPACQTVFRLLPAQLEARHGLVRCGHCQTPFDARAALIPVDSADLPPAPPPARKLPTPPQPPPPPAGRPPARGDALGLDSGSVTGSVTGLGSGASRSNASSAKPEVFRDGRLDFGSSSSKIDFWLPEGDDQPAGPLHLGAGDREPLFTGFPDELADYDPYDPYDLSSAPASSATTKQESDFPWLPHDEAAHASSASPRPSAHENREPERSKARQPQASPPLPAPPLVRKDSKPQTTQQSIAARYAQTTADQLPGSAEEERRAHEQWPSMLAEPGANGRASTLWSLGIGVMAVLLLAQSTIVFRNELAMKWPSLRPTLERLCTPLGCDLPLPRVARAIRVEASDLHLGEEPASFALSVQIRNLAHFPLAHPHLELTLTDARDRPLLRRVFEPAEWLPPQQQRPLGLLPRSELSAEIPFRVTGVPAMGYRVLAFYP